ncbi:MAG: tRNA (uridine(34)/cytosine(34)/5-carboxymethylaminomethyluridine(34)-2'-O)-methyltransferase TrmL [Deltaproteobacteria bacterium HGW-Deltaproteobacteria-17]|nr:MAG: tRNA (uridine(34)/cytosine(34)/5-carboxymethylaminomethyluridine(34)-2'-O)-methyltransferase TrmL [Deltaproteobacteria bacterium HGW-Deltaproteobacteria-17]
MISLSPIPSPVKIVLVEPEIPPNVGAISRICACIGSPLVLCGPLTFDENHPKRKRAGLDYWDKVEKEYHPDFETFFAQHTGTCWFLSTKVGRSLYEARFRPGDALVFGSESRGLPPELLARHQDTALRIPMIADIRSLNVANAAAIAAYEAVRQVYGLGGSDPGAGGAGCGSALAPEGPRV